MKNTKEVTREFTPGKSPVPIDENNPGQRAIISVTRGWVTNQKLKQLTDAYKDITATTAKGYKECVKAIATVRGLRTKLEKSRLEKNRVDHEKISIRNKEAKRILAALVEIETPLKEMRRVEDERIAKEKAEKERVEKERVDAIKQRIEDNFGQHQIDDLAGKPSAYMQARIRIIEAYDVGDAYQEFKDDAALLKRQLLERISRIFMARREQEQVEKKILADKAKLDAEKQKLADEAKRLEEQQKAFKEEQAKWRAKRAAEEKAPEEAEAEAEAEAGQEDEEEPPTEPAQEHTPEGTGGVGAQEEVQGGQVTGPQFYDEPEDEETVYPEDELSAVSREALASYGHRTNRENLVELIQEETGIKDFDNNALTDLLALARMMYWDDKFSNTIRDLAVLARKELELYENIPE